jgi:hypothetical protein
MNATYLAAVLAFAAGLMLLLLWAYLTTDNPRTNPILRKSTWLFVLPAAAIWALPNSISQFPLSMWVGVLLEECLKVYAARTEPHPRDRFALIALFGIWELMLAKSVNLVTGDRFPSEWGRAEVITLLIAAMVPVLMHVVTAAIYAFRFRGRLWAALVASWAVHTAFNEAADLLGISPLASAAKAIVLAIMLAAIWPWPPPPATTDGLKP